MWLGPRQGSSDFHLDKDAILGSFIGPSGRHLVFLAVSGLNHVNSVLRSLGGNILSAQVSFTHLNNYTVLTFKGPKRRIIKRQSRDTCI